MAEPGTTRPKPGVWQRVEQVCGEPRCQPIARRAWRSLAQLHASKGEVEPAARAWLADQRLAGARLPGEVRRYARTPDLEKACGPVDQRHGAGACRRLEREVLGEYTFVDFSTRTAGDEGLPPEVVRRVNEHYGVLLQDCLAAEARRLVPPAAESYQLRWMVTNDGRVAQVHLGRKEQEQGGFARCAREQFSWWRYPRYGGEGQHVEQTFSVSATASR